MAPRSRSPCKVSQLRGNVSLFKSLPAKPNWCYARGIFSAFAMVLAKCKNGCGRCHHAWTFRNVLYAKLSLACMSHSRIWQGGGHGYEIYTCHTKHTDCRPISTTHSIHWALHSTWCIGQRIAQRDGQPVGRWTGWATRWPVDGMGNPLAGGRDGQPVGRWTGYGQPVGRWTGWATRWPVDGIWATRWPVDGMGNPLAGGRDMGNPLAGGRDGQPVGRWTGYGQPVGRSTDGSDRPMARNIYNT